MLKGGEKLEVFFLPAQNPLEGWLSRPSKGNSTFWTTCRSNHSSDLGLLWPGTWQSWAWSELGRSVVEDDPKVVLAYTQ